MSVRLWSYYRSSCSFRARVALNLKGIKHEIVALNLVKGSHKEADYMKQNPQGLVPLLEINGEQFIQSGAILEYLDEKYPDKAPLLPSDLAERARARAAFAVIACDTQPVSNLGVINKVNAIQEGQGKLFAANAIQTGLTAVEQLMSNAGPFTMGEKLTMADIAIVAQLHNARRFGIDLHQFPRILRAEEECYKMDEFLEAHPYHQPDCPEKLQKQAWDWVENNFSDPRVPGK